MITRTNNRSGGFVIDVEVAGSIPQHVGCGDHSFTILRETGVRPYVSIIWKPSRNVTENAHIDPVKPYCVVLSAKWSCSEYIRPHLQSVK